MTVDTMVQLDNIIHILQNNKVRDLIEEGARLYYSDSETTINLIPLAIITGLLLLLLPIILEALTGLFETQSDSSGYGAPPTDSYQPQEVPAYGAPAPGYGAPAPGYDSPTQYRTFKDDALELASMISSSFQDNAVSQQEFSLDKITTALKSANHLLE